MKDNDNKLAEYTYYPDGTIKSLKNGSLYTEYAYDADKNLTGLKTMLGKEVLVDNRYSYDHNGNRTEGQQPGGTTRYTYDSVNQLTKIEYPAYTEQLYYDKAGNRSRRITDGTQEEYRYDSANHLTEYTRGGETTTFTYDKAGNLTADDRARYTYDLFNRTEKVETFDGHIQINHYDAEGLRSGIEEDGRLVQFIFRSQEVVTQLEEEKGMTRYIRGYDLIASDADSARTYYHYASDELGSITHVVEGEDILNRYEYDAWGNLTLCEETVENRFKFNGQQYDPISQQYYLRARYYNPVIGRFTQEDTYRGDGLNLYAYCRNNPVYYADPSGHYRILNPLGFHDICSPQRERHSGTYGELGSAHAPCHTRYRHRMPGQAWRSVLSRNPCSAGYRRCHLTEYTKGGETTKFTYDKAGNLMVDDRVRYTYDLFNRTEKVETFDGHVQINHYDAEGLRSGIEEDGRLVQFIFRGQEVVTQLEEEKGMTRYIRGYDLIASDADSARTYYYYASDELGSITHVVEGEDILNRYEYDAWGNLTLCEETVENRFKFNGQQYDPISQQYYLRARYYTPVIGRFTQEDTYRGDGLNLYAYCRNNPVYYADPSGHYRNCVKDAYDRIRQENPGMSAQDAYNLALKETGKDRIPNDTAQNTEQNRRQNPEVSVPDNGSNNQVRPDFIVSPNGIVINADITVDSIPKTQFTDQKLQHEFKHASDFGITGNWNKSMAAEYQQAIQSHINSATDVYASKYRGADVYVYFNNSTGIGAYVDCQGSYVGGWKFSSNQISYHQNNGVKIK